MLDLLAWSRVHDLIRDALDIGRIFDKVTRPMQEVEAVNGDPRELAVGYIVLAARRLPTLLRHSWGSEFLVVWVI